MKDIIKKLNDYMINSKTEGLDVPLFVERFIPELLTNYPLESFIYSSTSEEKKADAILSALKVKKEAEYNRPHKKGTQLDSYKLYCSFANPEYLLSQKEYYDYFSSFCNMPLCNSEYAINTKVAKAIQTLLSIGESQNNILLFLSKLWDNTYSLFVPESTLPEKDFDKSIDHIRSNVYSDAKRLLMPIKNNMLDAICATMTDMNENDIPLENISVKQLFSNSVKNNISITEPILIIEPSPYFLKSLKRNNPFRHRKITIVLQDELLIDLYNKIYNSSYYSFIHIDDLASSISSVDSFPTNVLLFGTHINDTGKKIECINLCLSHIKSTHVLFILDTDYYIQNKNSPIKKELSKTTINNIWLFPAGISHATKPEMKILLQCEYGYINNHSDYFPLIRYTLSSNNKEQYLCPQYFQAEINTNDFFSKDIKLRSIFRSSFLKSQVRSDKNRKAAESYVYSTEISVHYTISGRGTINQPYRLSTYVREPQGGSIKPPIILDSKRSTKKISPDEIDEWIESTYLASPSIRKVITDNYQKYYQHKPITLKSFVLFNYEWETTLPSKSLSILKDITYSLLGDKIISKINSEDISDVFDDEISFTNNHMILLSELFSIATKQGYCEINPVKDLIRSIHNERDSLYQIRTNLTIKHLNVNLFTQAYYNLINKIHKGDSIALASLTCLLTGLEPNIVCALKWKDIAIIHLSGEEDISFYQLCIQRQLCNDGSELKPFSRREQYRKLPCPSILSDLLSMEYEKAKNINLGMPQDYIENCYIFTDGSALNQPLSPALLRKENRKLIKSLNIPAEIIPIPDNAKGTIETNLSYYPYDIFRTNFDYYARHVGEFELGEIEYILGIQASTTFSKNYCDYSNDYSQLILFTKLNRIYKIALSKENCYASKEHKKINDSISVSSLSDPHDLTFLGIELSVPDNTDAIIAINTKHGYHINIQKMEN